MYFKFFLVRNQGKEDPNHLAGGANKLTHEFSYFMVYWRISLLRLFNCDYYYIFDGDYTQVRVSVHEALIAGFRNQGDGVTRILGLYVKSEKIFNKWSKNIIRQKFTAYAIPNGSMFGHVTLFLVTSYMSHLVDVPYRRTVVY